MAEQEIQDAIVVGAGPVGLSLALGLARRGRSVLVLEQEPSTAEHSRAPAIWPGTQEILGELGVIDRFTETGIAVEAPEIFGVDGGRPLLRIPLHELADVTPYPRLLIVPQSTTERLLSEAVAELPRAEIRFGCAVTGLEVDPGGVTVHFDGPGGAGTARSRFVAGCDGASSTVRHALGARFDGITYDTRAALADVTLAESTELAFPRLTTRPELAIAIRIDGDLWRLILPIPRRGADRPLEQRIADAVDNLFDGAAYEPVWESHFRLHRRLAEPWTRGRVVLAGDAAHLNSPVGGQGMNAGIMDAAVLLPALDAAIEQGDPAPLKAYAETRRRAVATGVNRFTDVLTRMLFAFGGRLVVPLLKGANLLLRLRFVRRRVLRRVAMLNRTSGAPTGTRS